MSEQNSYNANLKIEDHINGSQMDDALKKNALDFVGFLKANGLLFDIYDSTTFTVDAEGVICIYSVDDIPGWTFFIGGYDSVLLRGEYQDHPVDGELEEFVWAHIKPCFHFTKNIRESGGVECGCGDQPGRSITIFGKGFDNVCHAALYFRNPEGGTLELMKRLALFWQKTNADAVKKD